MNIENSKTTTSLSNTCSSVGGVRLRDSNLELFRIITMMLIVAHHYVVNSGLTAVDGPIYSNYLSWHSLFLLLFGAWGKVGINCFVLITGYFMCKSEISLIKFVKLLLQIELYNFLFYFIFLISGYQPFSIKIFIVNIFPIQFFSSNFIGCYLLFFLFIPFINVLIKNINEKQHLNLIYLCCFIYVVLGTIPFINVKMNYISWFIVLYFISSYIRLYPKKIFSNTIFWSWMTFCTFLVSLFSVLACAWLSSKLNLHYHYYFVVDSNKILAVVTAVSSFLFFKNINIKYSKFINAVAATTFGVLLIHANSDTMRQWLWKDTLDNVGMFYSPYFFIHAFGCVIGVFVVCSFIDHLRIRFIEKPFFKLWDKYSSNSWVHS